MIASEKTYLMVTIPQLQNLISEMATSEFVYEQTMILECYSLDAVYNFPDFFEGGFDIIIAYFLTY